jgi:hypothetical protein
MYTAYFFAALSMGLAMISMQSQVGLNHGPFIFLLIGAVLPWMLLVKTTLKTRKVAISPKEAD